MEVSAKDWGRAFALLDQVLELPAEQRAAWLATLHADDENIKPLLAELLEQQPKIDTDGFLGELPQFSQLDRTGGEEPVVPKGLQTGDAVGPYRLIRELGVGGMGAVWQAERADGVLKRPVALKLPHPGPFQQQLAERFQRERDILAALTHPHIARLYDAGATSTGQPYLALEYVEGVPLNEYCTQKKLDVRARLSLFLQVLSAVQYAHTNLVLHRDLKPSNILVTAVGDVQLLDFGIAKFMSGNEARETELTRIAGRALTPDYASPEQILGAPINTASDVYSLGVILYELLSGARPYKLKRGTRGELEDAILSADVSRPSVAMRKLLNSRLDSTEPAAVKAVRELEGDLDVICIKALKKQPEQRFPTVAAFAAEIERYLQGLPIETRSESRLYTAQKFVARNRTVVGLSAFAACALIAGTITATIQARRASSEAEIAREQSARAQAVQQFLTGLFTANSVDQPDPQAAQRTTARELLDRGAARIDRQLLGFPDAKADLLQTLSEMYVHLGDWERASALNGERLNLMEKLHGKKSMQYAKALNQSIFLLNGARRFDAEVLKQAAEAKQILTELKQDKSEAFGELLRLESVVLRQRDLDAAVDSARRAVAILRPLNDESRDFAKRLGLALGDLGMTYAARGNYQLADEALREGLKMLTETRGSDNLDTAFVRVCLGTVDVLRGNFVDAGARLGEGAEQVRRAGGANQPASVFADSVLGMFLYQTGREREGLALLANARDRITQRLGPTHPRTVDATVLYADLLVAEGRADEAIELVAPFAEEDIPYRPSVETVLGKALLQKREFSRAESVLQSAIAAFEKRKARRGRWWTEALLTRGELKLAEGQWQAAQLDFDAVIAAIEETGAGGQFAVRARAGAARVALALGNWAAARKHQAQAVAAISDPRVNGLLARYSADLARLGTCLTEAEKGRPPKPSPKGVCAA